MNWRGEFDFAKIGRAPAHFDPEELGGAERHDRCTMPYDAVRALEPMGVDANLWEAIKPNLARFATPATWRGW